jgi:hypothetical protein
MTQLLQLQQCAENQKIIKTVFVEEYIQETPRSNFSKLKSFNAFKTIIVAVCLVLASMKVKRFYFGVCCVLRRMQMLFI